ncbi:hypothetical protein LUZ60_012264 [Juncus effusus]|nr:hypothetical protein LUZ60_012264 [Juncus effusus]
MASSKLRGPRPAPLMVGSDSHKIQKSVKRPVIIYMVSPEIIHVEAGEFMSLVQRLTGPDSPPSGSDHKANKQSNSSVDDRDKRQFPVRVKARALNRTSSVVVNKQQLSPQSPTSPALFFQDLSPLSRGGNALKEGAVASQGWFHSNGDFLGQTHGAGLGSPTSFLDVFGPMPPHQP